MDTKLKGDIGQLHAALAALNRGWDVSQPIGDRLPYDLIFDIDGCLFKIQVKVAWRHEKSKSYIVDSRRTKTNRRKMIRDRYCNSDFDFAVIYVAGLDVFYVMPSSVFNEYKSNIYIIMDAKRQRKPKSWQYKEAWFLLDDAVKMAKADSNKL